MTREPPRGQTAEGGFALVLVLWTVVLVALMVVGLAAAARSDAQTAANLRGAAELEAQADGAIHTAIFRLMRPGGPQVSEAGQAVSVDIISLSGRVNPNTASPELLRALLLRLGADADRAGQVAEAVVDWRSSGSGTRPAGAKAAAYRSAGLAYGPPSAPFETLDELRYVLGMTPALLAAALPHMSLYWDGAPDPAQAGPVVRAALRDAGLVRGAAATGHSVVEITAAAGRADGARAVRRAVVRIGPSGNRRGWRVLAWGLG